jgi:hypothetical protein
MKLDSILPIEMKWKVLSEIGSSMFMMNFVGGKDMRK